MHVEISLHTREALELFAEYALKLAKITKTIAELEASYTPAAQTVAGGPPAHVVTTPAPEPSLGERESAEEVPVKKAPGRPKKVAETKPAPEPEPDDADADENEGFSPFDDEDEAPAAPTFDPLVKRAEIKEVVRALHRTKADQAIVPLRKLFKAYGVEKQSELRDDQLQGFFDEVSAL